MTANCQPADPSGVAPRLTSLDAYRGFVMLLMMGEVLQFAQVSQVCPDSDCFCEFKQN